MWQRKCYSFILELFLFFGEFKAVLVSELYFFVYFLCTLPSSINWIQFIVTNAQEEDLTSLWKVAWAVKHLC